MKLPNRVNPTTNHLQHLSLALALGWAASAAFLAGTAKADTTINSGNSPYVVTDPNDFNANAGTVTIDNTGNLQFRPAAQGTYSLANNFILAGSGGTINLGFKANDTFYTLTGTVTSDPTATGPQTLAISTGLDNNGDREEVTFDSGIPNVFDGSDMGLLVTFTVQDKGYSFVNLKGLNTFTGPITTLTGAGNPTGYLTIGGRGIGGSNAYNVTPGTGTLNGGSYAGDISLAASTFLSYASTTDQSSPAAFRVRGVSGRKAPAL